MVLKVILFIELDEYVKEDINCCPTCVMARTAVVLRWEIMKIL